MYTNNTALNTGREGGGGGGGMQYWNEQVHTSPNNQLLLFLMNNQKVTWTTVSMSLSFDSLGGFSSEKRRGRLDAAQDKVTVSIFW